MKKLIMLISLAMATSFSLSTSALGADFSCVGTDPFWAITLTKTAIVFKAATEKATKEDLISRTTAEGVGSDFAFIAKTSNSTATVISGDCNDGRTDNTYSHHIMYSNSQRAYYGCCNQN